MSFNANLVVPWGYQTATRTLGQVKVELDKHYHPEYTRRLLAWLTSMNGGIGIGGHFRPDGTQPTDPGFAPEGKSFHQNQEYNDGFIGACAVDVVAKNPVPTGIHLSVSWAMVPKQGSALATTWGVHANVDGEPWHIQPIEIDGWQSWKDRGSPAPRANYPLPGGNPPPPPPPPLGGTVLLYKVRAGDSYWKICETVFEDGRATNTRVALLKEVNANRELHPGDIINIPGRVAV